MSEVMLLAKKIEALPNEIKLHLQSYVDFLWVTYANETMPEIEQGKENKALLKKFLLSREATLKNNNYKGLTTEELTRKVYATLY